MEQEIFKAGVRPGSPNTQTEIKMLICFIMSNTRQPISFSQLYGALSEKDLVNYFDLVQSVDELCWSGHILKSGEDAEADIFTVTRLGEQAGEEFTSALPLSVKEKALLAVQKLLAREKRQAELRVEVTPAQGEGFRLRLSIPDEDGELACFTLYAPTREQSNLIQKRFLNAPQFIYKGVLALLTGNRAVLDEVFPPPEDQLF